MKTVDQKAIKYSFPLCRFSSDAQRGGSSIQRQIENARQRAEGRYIFRDDWAVTQEALSAYKKENFPGLLALIDDVKAGKIPQGTVCQIEAIDRLTRANLDEGREMIRQMLLAGLDIEDNEGNYYTKEDLNDFTKMVVMLSKIVAANEYSARLSKRIKDTYSLRNARIAKGEIIARTKEGAARKDCPAWVTGTGAGYELNGKAEIVAGMFTDYLNGNGPASIARKLNAAKVPTFRNEGEWGQGIVYTLLSDRRVIGQIKINGDYVQYYPAAVDADTFNSAQARKQDNYNKPVTGKDDHGIVNLFSGVARCTCGAAVKVVTGGEYGHYVTCYGKIKGTTDCNAPMSKYAPFEQSFAHMLKLNPVKLCNDENTINAELQILRGKLAEVEKRIANIGEKVENGLASNDLVKRQIALEAEAEEIKQQIAVESVKTSTVKTSGDRLTEIYAELHNLKNDQSLRAKVQAFIRENINAVTIDTTAKTFTVDFKNGNLIDMDMSGNMRGIKSVAAVFPVNPVAVPQAAVK